MNEQDLEKLFYVLNNCDLDKDFDELKQHYNLTSEMEYYIRVQTHKNKLLEEYTKYLLQH